jgi:beta-aspartyl-peptidase (threonine type)
MTTSPTYSLGIHGGAGASRKIDYARVRAHLRESVELGRNMLARGDQAIDVACAVVAEMEQSGLYVAGRGASPNRNGDYELDACVMEGKSRSAGSAAALRGFKSPVSVARLIMDRTPHVMLCGPGAEEFAAKCGAERIPDPAAWFTPAGIGESNFAPSRRDHGTVGCVARDESGALAAATSTAGVFDKTPGRVGDSPLIGAGGWADANAAVSCTGQGELFIKLAAAARVAFLVENGRTVAAAAQSVVDALATWDGDGGLIALGVRGEVAMPYRSEGMKRAWLSEDGAVHVRILADD